MLNIILLLVGFVLLVKGADMFVAGSSGIAKKLKIPSIVIGLTIVAFGTSAPEAAVSITAAVSGQNEIALGNIVGSNIFNLLIVAGLCGAIKPLKVNEGMVKKEIPFSILSAIVLLVLSVDILLGQSQTNAISRADGLILLVFFIIFLYSVLNMALNQRKTAETANNEQVDDMAQSKKLSISIISAVIGIICVVLGGKFVVDSSVNIATAIGISQTVIGLTIVAVGTSLPELVTSIIATRRGENEIAMGNVIGSNIFNIFFILGASAAISPIPVLSVSIIDILVLISVSLMTYVFSLTGRKINRIEGSIFVTLYILYMTYIIIR